MDPFSLLFRSMACRDTGHASFYVTRMHLVKDYRTNLRVYEKYIRNGQEEQLLQKNCSVFILMGYLLLAVRERGIAGW